MSKIIGVIVLSILIFAGGQAFAGEKNKGNDRNPPKSQASEVIISGKLFCPLTRHVILPFHGTIISSDASSGQSIKKGDVLARYRLAPEAALKLHRQVSKFHIKELEIRVAETDNNLAKLEDKRKEIRQLSDHKMAPAHSLTQINREIELLNKQKALMQERLPLERALAEENRAVIGELLGNPVKHGYVPQEGFLKAPIGCHVLWVHPDLRENAEFKQGTRVFLVGVMDPMLIRAQVHEIEAVQLGLGDMANFSLESIPGRTFKAKVSRISWAAMTPQVDRPSYYEVELEVPNPDFILREGLRGRIVFRKQRDSGT